MDTASLGGSLQADGRLLWHQDQGCRACVTQVLAGPVLAGPGRNVTAAEIQPVGRDQTRISVVRIPLAGGHAVVLYSVLFNTTQVYVPILGEDSSARYVTLWVSPHTSGAPPNVQPGWISDGKLIPLPAPGPLNDLVAW